LRQGFWGFQEAGRFSGGSFLGPGFGNSLWLGNFPSQNKQALLAGILFREEAINYC